MSPSAVSAAVAERAMQWLVELQAAPTDGELVAGLARWRQASPEHEAAWQRIEFFTQGLAVATPAARGALARASLAADPGLSRRGVLKGMAGLLVVGGAAWYGRETPAWREWTADYRTGVGEQRHVALADGSQLWLNTASALDLAFDSRQRQLALIAGEIFLQAQEDTRPLSVASRDGLLRASAATLSLRLYPAYTRLSVHKGQAQLALGQVSGDLVLSEGQQVLFDRRRTLTRQSVSESAAAWTEGKLIASGQRLDEFLVELSRYRRGHLGCDPALSGLQVSGTYPLGDTERILDSLGHSLHLKVRRLTRYWVDLQAVG